MDSSSKINWMQFKMDCSLVMYLESDCSKWEWGYDGNTINVLKLLHDGLFYTMGSGCVKSVNL